MAASRIISKSLKYVGIAILSSTSLATGTFLLITRKTKIHVFPADHRDPSPFFEKYNPSHHPVSADIATRYVELHRLPIDLQDHVRNGDGGELVRRFCAHLFASVAFEAQRKYLHDTSSRLPGREGQLWSKMELLESDYDVGTKLVDHFEVLAHSTTEIVMRCGDTPTRGSTRLNDGLLTIRARYRPEHEDIEFQLSSTLFNGLIKTDDGPMPEWMDLLHQAYTKFWMESSVRSMMRPL